VSHSLRLGRIAGIRVGLHWSVAIFAAFISWNLATLYFPEFAPGHSGAVYALSGFIAAVLLAGSILAHELGHSLVALRHGVPIRSITLWLMGGVAHMGREAATPRQACEIAAAGPAVSVAVAFAAGLSAVGAAMVGFGALTVATLGYLALVNAGLALFNLIPALPLDGGRILHAWKWHRGGDREVATVDAARIGRLFGFAIIGFGLFQLLASTGSGLWSILLGFFVLGQAGAERRRAERRIALRNRPALSPLAAMLERFLRPGSTTADTRHGTVFAPGDHHHDEPSAANREAFYQDPFTRARFDRGGGSGRFPGERVIETVEVTRVD